MIKTTTSAALVGALVLASCGGGSDAEPFDADRACRIGERLVEETASGDRDGVIRQIERLDDLDGIADSGIEVDDLDAIAEDLDEQAVEDLVAEFDVLECDLEAPEIAEPEPEPEPTTPDTTATPETTVAEEPASTEPATDTTVATETTETTEAPGDTAAPPADPPAGGGISVDVGSTGPGAETGVNRPTEDIIAEYGLADYLFSPNTNIIELRVSRTDNTFSDDVEYSNSESITMSAATTMTIEEVRAAYRTALEGLGIDFDFSESTSSDDGRETVGVEADPTDFDLELGSWEVTVAQDAETPGVVLIEVDRFSSVAGPLPAIVEPARPLLQETADIGADLGWTVTGYTHSLSSFSFDGSVTESGRVEWDVSEDNTVREAATALQDAVGIPIESEEVDDDRISWFLDDGSFTLFAVNYFESGGTTASYSP